MKLFASLRRNLNTRTQAHRSPLRPRLVVEYLEDRCVPSTLTELAVWFTEKGTNRIGRMSTTGQFSELAIPTIASVPMGIAKRADGTLWFTEQAGNRLGEIAV
jgi:hypothetical protein